MALHAGHYSFIRFTFHHPKLAIDELRERKFFILQISMKAVKNKILGPRDILFGTPIAVHSLGDT